MKSSYLTISLFFILASLFASGQTNEQAKPGGRSPITKGYYCISNSTPVADAGTRLAAGTGTTASVAKGYLSIPSTSPKIKIVSGWLLPKQARPAIKKGYYSIGDNMQRFPGAGKQ